VKKVWNLILRGISRGGEGSRDKNKISFSLREVAFLVPHLKKNVKRYLGLLGLLILSSLLSIPAPAITGYIIDNVFIRKDLAKLTTLVGLLFVLLLIVEIVRAVQEFYMYMLSQEFNYSVRSQLIERIVRYPMSFFRKNQSGYLVSRLDEINILGGFFTVTLLSLAENMIRFLGSAFFIIRFNLKLTLFSLAILPLFFEVARRSKGAFRTTSFSAMESNANTKARIQETFSGIELIKTFAKEEHETSRINNSLRLTMNTEIIQNLLSSISGRVLGIIVGLNLLVILWVGGNEIIAGRLSVGQYFAFTAYVGYLYSPIQLFSMTFLTWQRVLIACKRISTFTVDTTEDEGPNRIYKFTSLIGEIRFRNVTFNYEDGEDVLHDISLFIQRHEKVALVGRSGAGKSTIVNLILGLYTPTKGQVEIDGVDLRTTRLRSLRDRIGIVSQNIFLFDDTILNNIKYSWPEAGMDEVVIAAKASGCHDFITQFPNGYETNAGEIGNRLSGGEKQRISIARSLIKKPDLIILDEPTAHLDAPAIRAIIDTIQELFRKQTCLIISHNASNIHWVDKIIVLDKGHIVQEGSHFDLIRKVGEYRNLFMNDSVNSNG
jgi:ABC-type bacteriocin/lantibiotic exporter with double-glycine peptidase domain